jgi:curved DNA-binding protein CbpA
MLQTPEVQQSRGSHDADGKTLLSGDDNISTPSTVAVSPFMTPQSETDASPYDEDDATPTGKRTSMSTSTSSAMTVIHQAYGPTADLYRDVLWIEPDATDREIRTAYFRRGRQVLIEEPDEGGVQGGGAVAAGGAAGPLSMAAVSQRSKLQFQAVSVAFDILSDPELKRQYDATGTVALVDTGSYDPANSKDGDTHSHGCAEVQEAAPHTTTTVVTGASLFLRSRLKEVGLKSSLNGRYSLQRNRSKNLDCNSSAGSSKRGIRWSNSVEELVIENDEQSIASRRSWKCVGGLDEGDAAGEGAGGNNDGDDSNSVESATSSSVKETLRRLDESAETFTRKEFLDDLESSVTSLLDAASRAITEAAASTAATATANAANTTESADNSNKGAKSKNIETAGKDPVSRKLDFDKADTDDEPEKQQGEPTHLSSDSPAEDTTAKAKTNPKATTEENSAADFYLSLSTYICGVVQELRGSLGQVGSFCGVGEVPNPCSFVIQDSELDGLVHMLRTEVDQDVVPFDQDPSGESPLGKTIETFDTESIASTIATERNAPAGS